MDNTTLCHGGGSKKSTEWKVKTMTIFYLSADNNLRNIRVNAGRFSDDRREILTFGNRENHTNQSSIGIIQNVHLISQSRMK